MPQPASEMGTVTTCVCNNPSCSTLSSNVKVTLTTAVSVHGLVLVMHCCKKTDLLGRKPMLWSKCLFSLLSEKILLIPEKNSDAYHW